MAYVLEYGPVPLQASASGGRRGAPGRAGYTAGL